MRSSGDTHDQTTTIKNNEIEPQIQFWWFCLRLKAHPEPEV